MIWHFAREKTHEIPINIGQGLRVVENNILFYHLMCEIKKLKNHRFILK